MKSHASSVSSVRGTTSSAEKREPPFIAHLYYNGFFSRLPLIDGDENAEIFPVGRVPENVLREILQYRLERDPVPEDINRLLRQDNFRLETVFRAVFLREFERGLHEFRYLAQHRLHARYRVRV